MSISQVEVGHHLSLQDVMNVLTVFQLQIWRITWRNCIIVRKHQRTICIGKGAFQGTGVGGTTFIPSTIQVDTMHSRNVFHLGNWMRWPSLYSSKYNDLLNFRNTLHRSCGDGRLAGGARSDEAFKCDECHYLVFRIVSFNLRHSLYCL